MKNWEMSFNLLRIQIRKALASQVEQMIKKNISKISMRIKLIDIYKSSLYFLQLLNNLRIKIMILNIQIILILTKLLNIHSEEMRTKNNNNLQK
jgi:hypothetical protein